MTTSILDPRVATPRLGPTQSVQRQRHLVLVPTGAGELRPRGAIAAPVPVRLTAFGRLVVAVVAAILLALLLSAFAGSFASATGEAREITVGAGQTLSGIAAEHLPELPVRDAVVELQVLNGLSTSQVHAGQRLLIPAR